MRKNLFVLALLPIFLLGCSKNTNIEEYETIIEDDKVILHTAVQRAFLKGPLDDINLYVRGVEELSRPLTPTFSWEEKEGPYTVFLSDQPDFSNAFTYTTDKNEITFSNLKIGTDYRYKVFSGSSLIVNETFTTSSEIIRNIYISGVTNARDLGGYVTDEGVIKQGLIYRTARLNESSVDEVENRITSSGIETMLNELNVKTEIDLRLVSNNEVGGLKEGIGVLGETVKYYQCPMDYDIEATMKAEINDSSLRRVFSILGNKDNYPLFYHCSIGTDRTGYISWLINACLGVKEEYLWRDYLFSNFGRISGSRNRKTIENGYLKDIEETNGNSMKEKTINYLIDKGVNPKDIDAIRDIMIAK